MNALPITANTNSILTRYTTNRATKKRKQAAVYRPADFHYDVETQTCVCPAGKTLYRNGSHCVIGGFAAVKFQGAQQDCVPCGQRDQCLRTPVKTKTRQVAFFHGRAAGQEMSFIDRMKVRIDSPEGQA